MEREVKIFLHIPKTGGVGNTDMLKLAFPGGVQVFPNFAIDQEIAKETKIIMGHLKFGCHRDLSPGGLRWRYLAMVRDPVDRVFSHWAYLQRQGRMKLDFVQLMRSRKAIADNLMVRMLVGKPWLEWESDNPPVTEADFRLAKYHLAQYFDWVGVLERHEKSIARLGEYLGVPLKRINTNGWTHGREMTEEERQIATERHIWDMYLYRWIRDAYDYP